MRRTALVSLAGLCAALAAPARAHDPRTTAKDFVHALVLEGAGRLELKYKSMHWNPQAYDRFKTDAAVRERVNARVWNAIGTAEVGFDVAIDGQTIPKGSYPFGLNIEEGDKFALVLKVGDALRSFPLQVAAGAEKQEYLTFSIYPSDKADTFVLEGRCGAFRGTTQLKVPYLAEHAPGAPAHH